MKISNSIKMLKIDNMVAPGWNQLDIVNVSWFYVNPIQFSKKINQMHLMVNLGFYNVGGNKCYQIPGSYSIINEVRTVVVSI